jgi:hypothetical protein
MKHRFAAASAALTLATLIAGCAATPDPNYATLPPEIRENPTGSRIPRVKKPVTEEERRRAQADANAMREGMRADGLSNQGR